MATHEGLRAWAYYAHRASKRDKMCLRRSNRIVRILVIQVDLGVKL